MLRHTLREWRDRHLWILLSISLAALFCIYRITLPSPIFINVGTEGDERYLGNFHFREQSEFYPFRWTKDSSYIRIPNLGSLPLEIILGADAPRPEGQSPPRVSLIANRTVLADFTMESGLSAHQFLYHPPLFPLPRDLLLEVKSDTFVPPGDSRALGIVLNSIEVKPVSSPFRLFQICLAGSLMGALSTVFSYLLLRWLDLSQKKSFVCAIVILALLGLGIVQQFIVVRVLVMVFGLLLMSYLLAILLETVGYREVLITRSGLGKKTLETWAGNPVSLIYNSIKAQALSPHSQSSGISDFLPAYLPAVVLFILMPFALYLPNQNILDNNLTLVIPYLVLAVMYLAFLVALLLFVGEPLRTIIVILLFYIGLYLCLSDIVSPVQLGELMSGRETPTEPFFLTVIEVALAVVIIFSVTKLSWKHVKYFGSVFVLILLLSELIIVINGVLPNAGLLGMESREDTLSNPPEKPTSRGNVYHITFDSYSSVIFLESMEKMNLANDFYGFTFFSKTRSNYMFTEESLPSYMTGTFYEENESLKEWTERHKYSGVVNNLYDAGYEVSMYTPRSGWGHPKASHLMAHKDVLKQYKSLSSFYHFADIWLLRVVPNFLQQEVYWEGKGVFTRLFAKDDRLAGKNAEVFASVELMRQLISDEAGRPDHGQYVYAHLWIPHSPYTMNRDCVFSPACGYEEQTVCATRLMAELISELKELGRYHESIIIFQSDHGPSQIVVDSKMSLDIKKKIDALNPQGFRVEQVENRTPALLLIKPPLQLGKPLIISDRPTQLADIPATIYDLLNLPRSTNEGQSAFSPDFPQTREIHIFAGLRLQTDEKGEEYRFGVNLFEGEANHLSFTEGKGWKVYPSIHVRWE